MTLGEKIQSLRMEQGLSQEGLAERLGVSRQAISKWELDKTVPDVKYILALSELFAVTTDYLLKDGAEKIPPSSAAASRCFDPPPPREREPVRIKAACLILGCGNVVLLMLLLFSVCKNALWNKQSNIPLFAIWIIAPILIALSTGLLWDGPLLPSVERRFRRGVGSAAILMGFAAAVFFGYHEVVEDLLIKQVEGAGSVPLFFTITAGLMLLFWIFGCILAAVLVKNLNHT